MLSTSVVSAIDSGPSPRSCCDAGGFKNLLGSFHAPVLNISDRSFEDVIDVLEQTLRDFEVEERDIIEILGKARSLKKQIVS